VTGEAGHGQRMPRRSQRAKDFPEQRIGVFGEGTNPVATYQQFAWNLGQTVLRSESESHFLPADWPTFAQLDAYARRDPSPLLRSAERNSGLGSRRA